MGSVSESVGAIAVMVTYGLLTLSIIGLWIFPSTGLRHRHWPLTLLIVLCVGYGIGVGLLQPVALVSMGLLGLSVYLVEQDALPVPLRILSASLPVFRKRPCLEDSSSVIWSDA